jgi:hypothetical protein
MLNKTIFFVGLVAIFGLLTSCSVVMAAKKEGTSIDKVQACHSRGQFLSCGAIIVSSERLCTGELVETYQFQKERGSAARALMHGALDVSTLGLWEVVGTPIEVCVDEKTYFSIRVYYDENEIAKKIELI